MSIANDTPKGSIIVEQAYAQAKMLDHSSWRLGGGRAMSDIDAVLDHGGHVLFVELSRAVGPITWADISGGQRWLYSSIAKLSPKVACVLARHDVASAERQIDTRNDIVDGWALFAQGTRGAPLSGDDYRDLVERWDRDPVAALAWLDELHVAWFARQRQAAAGGAS
jgi:hypothetical protein